MSEGPPESPGFAAGGKVRLKSDPSRVGRLTGQVEEHRGRRRLEVTYSDGSGAAFVPELALEPVEAGPTNPYQMMRDRRFCRIAVLRQALTYYRLSGRLADLIYSLNTTNTDFYAWQFKPVLSFLESTSGGMLIADEVGLGKTIEAGLIWTELRSRGDARRLLVLCPAMLREKWRRELSDRFGVEAEICNASELLDRLTAAADDRSTSFALIGSLQGLRPPAGWREEEDEDRSPSSALAHFLLERSAEEPLLDLLVIDEAHYLRNPETQTARLGRLFRPVTEGLVLLSATPVQMRSADLYHLLNLIDEDTFQHPWSFDQILEENAPLVALRDRLMRAPMDADEFESGLRAAADSRKLLRSASLARLLEEPPSADMLQQPSGRAAIAEKLDRANPLTRVLCRTRKRDVQERRVRRNVYAIRCPLSPTESQLYEEVTERVRSYCTGLGVGEGFLLTIPQRQLCSSMPAAIRAWQRGMDDVEVDEIVQEVFADLDALNPDGPATGRRTVTPLIHELARIAHEAGNFEVLRRHDSKFQQLEEQLRGYWEKYPDGKVVVFAYFKETLRYLHERLEELGISSALLYGGMDKDAILGRFADERGPKVLLSSEVASEGVDLQFSSVVVNYDLPWNPMRVEQRIGRIDRLGQKADVVLVWNFFYEDTLDDRVYSRLLDRLKIFEQALGSTEAVLGESIRKMSYELLRHHLTAEEEAEVVERARVVVEHNARLEDQLESDAGRLVAHGAYVQTKIAMARELHRYVTGEDLFSYVTDFFAGAYPGSQFVIHDRDGLRVGADLSADARRALGDFIERQRLYGQTQLAMPVVGRVDCHFDNRMSARRRGVETIHQVHPLVSFVTRSLKSREADSVVPAAAATVGAEKLTGVEPGVYVFAVQRWSFTGQRQVERLVFSAATLEPALQSLDEQAAEGLVTGTVLSGSEWLNAPGEIDGKLAHEAAHDRVEDLERRFARFVSDMRLENEDRISLQIEVLQRHEAARKQQLEERIGRMRTENKLNAVRMFSSQLAKHLARCEDRRIELENRRETASEARLVALGVVRVT
jgi:superfamily II DNA or RNA helicase